MQQSSLTETLHGGNSIINLPDPPTFSIKEKLREQKQRKLVFYAIFLAHNFVILAIKVSVCFPAARRPILGHMAKVISYSTSRIWMDTMIQIKDM